MVSLKKGSAMGSHQSATMLNDEWLTPPAIVSALGTFDLDPCSPVERPWPTALNHYNQFDNGLLLPWIGRIWLNPPYGLEAAKWLKKLRNHTNGIALTFARTETKMFFDNVWHGKADSIFFFDGRLHFHYVDGTRAKANAGAPSCLIAYGENNSDAIELSGLKGHHLPIKYVPMIIVGISPSWSSVVKIAVSKFNGEAAIKDIYKMVEEIAPDKVGKNSNYKEKIRQKLQELFIRKERGIYFSTTANNIISV